MNTNLMIALGLALALALGFSMFTRAGNTPAPDARALVAAGARLLDVRTPGEFEGGHLPGALNIPLQDLQHRLGELAAKEQPIVVYCRSGNRSAQAANLLKSAGYSSIHDLGAMSR
jgi:rhodanese-related sulfurtransferase